MYNGYAGKERKLNTLVLNVWLNNSFGISHKLAYAPVRQRQLFSLFGTSNH